MERYFVTPNDEGIMDTTDSRSIINAVAFAKQQNYNKVVIPRFNKRTGKCQWDIDETIILPSDMHIVLDNCYLRQADGSMDNVFRNFNDTNIRNSQDGIDLRWAVMIS